MGSTTWTDARGKQWSARMTIGEAIRIKSEDGIDLLDAEQLGTTTNDPLAVVHLLCCVHGPQIEKNGMTRGDFAEICTETEAIANAAVDALVEALADFFGRLRKPALASVVRKAIEAARATENQAQQMRETRGDEVLTSVMRKSRDALAKAIDAAIN